MTQNNAHLIYNLVNAKTKIRNANTDGTNPYHDSKYATLESVIEAVTAPLLEHGIVWQQISHDCDTGAKIETILMGHGGEIYCGPVYVPADKKSAHAFGSALTYARRYSLSVAVGIGADDDDGNQAQDNPPVDVGMKYNLWKNDEQTIVLFGTGDFCNELRHTLKGKSEADRNMICQANKVQIADALLDAKADTELTETKRNNRVKFLDEVMAYADAT